MWRLPGILFLLSISVEVQTASAALLFNPIYEDVLNNTNVGFDDPVWGAARRDSLQAVFQYISGELDPVVYNTTIDYRVYESETDGSGLLGVAGTFWNVAPNGFQRGYVSEHAMTGIDPSASFSDGWSRFDFGYDWHLGTGSNPGGLFDFFSVALHEVTHSMGFLSELFANGTSGITGANPGVFPLFNSFLELGDGTKLFDGLPGEFTGTLADLVSDDIYFDGPFVRAANGGQPIKIFAPNPAQPGSSWGHFDDSIAAVMNPFSDPGVEQRTWATLDRAVLQDLGWQFASVNAVPEPSSIALALTGIAAVTLTRWRSKAPPRQAP